MLRQEHMAVPQWMLTALALLALLICCSGQFTLGGSSNCVAMVKLDQTWTSNVTGYYIAMLEIDIEWMGSQALAPGNYDFSVRCPTYLKVLDTQGWSATGLEDGNITGTMQLTDPLERFDRGFTTLTVEGSSPQRFYPTSVAFDGEKCYQQQLKK